jgi:serine phosphatase RsbU (regulator of sigma subunit)
LDGERFAGYRIVRFSGASEEGLREIALRLLPHQERIIDTWISQQWRVWQPPGISREELRQVFGDLFRGLLSRLEARELQASLTDLEVTGSQLAEQHFPFEALIISIHFMEESYLPFLLNPPSPSSQKWLIVMDEFLHAALASIATSYFDAHRRELVEEAEVGRVVQEGLLTPIPRAVHDLEVAHIYTSAHERARLGGDFLDFFAMDRANSAFIIGDLSGHGLEAAADSVLLRSLFRGFMREEPDPRLAMRRVNRVLVSELQNDQFATALAIIYHAPGELTIVSAGHPYPVICGNSCHTLEPNGMALAIDPDVTYEASNFTLDPGALFIAYTDGLIEATDGKVLFGEERLMKEVSRVRDAPARAIAEHLVDAARRHAGGRFADDVAVLVLKRRPAGC